MGLAAAVPVIRTGDAQPRRPAAADCAAAAKSVTAAKLLKAAGELMTERNSIDISLSELAKKSGINAALVKYHFGNKDGLLLALLARDSQLGDRKPRLPDAAADFADREAEAAHRRHHQGLSPLALSQPPDPSPALRKQREVGARRCRACSPRPCSNSSGGCWRRALQAGEFRKVDPVLFYISLIGACDHLFHGRTAMSPVLGFGAVTDEVRSAATWRT